MKKCDNMAVISFHKFFTWNLKPFFSVIEVVLNRPLFQCFDYKLEGSYADDIVGARVEV